MSVFVEVFFNCQKAYALTREGGGEKREKERERKKTPPSPHWSMVIPQSLLLHITNLSRFGVCIHMWPSVFFKQPGPGFKLLSDLAPLTTRLRGWLTQKFKVYSNFTILNVSKDPAP